MLSCHIASIPEREDSLKQVLASISPLVDKTYVALNGYTEIPEWIRDLRIVECEIFDNSLGDAAKFLKCFIEPSICLTLDDDLIVTERYVTYMLGGLKKYGGVVGLHGRNYSKRPIMHFKKDFTSNYRCLNTVNENVKVDLIGTGCMIFDNTQIKLDRSLFEYKNMADVLFSRLCHKQGIPMTVLKHTAHELLRYIPQIKTIWNTTKDDSIQTFIVNSFLK